MARFGRWKDAKQPMSYPKPTPALSSDRAGGRQGGTDDLIVRRQSVKRAFEKLKDKNFLKETRVSKETLSRGHRFGGSRRGGLYKKSTEYYRDPSVETGRRKNILKLFDTPEILSKKKKLKGYTGAFARVSTRSGRTTKRGGVPGMFVKYYHGPSSKKGGLKKFINPHSAGGPTRAKKTVKGGETSADWWPGSKPGGIHDMGGRLRARAVTATKRGGVKELYAKYRKRDRYVNMLLEKKPTKTKTGGRPRSPTRTTKRGGSMKYLWPSPGITPKYARA